MDFLSDKTSLARICCVKGKSGDFARGFEVIYNIDGEEASAGEHFASNDGDIVGLALDPDEYINAAFGGCGGLVDRFVLRTSKGKEARFGNSDGGDSFEFEIPAGRQVIAFHGGTNGDLHNIGVYFR